MVSPKERIRFVPSQTLLTQTTASLRPSRDETRSTATESSDAPSMVANRYEVLGRLGSGGFGVVYRVRDSSDGGMRALKIMPRIEGVGNLRLEFSSMARLQHPNIVRVYDYGVTETGEDFFTMALVNGGDIRALAPDVTDRSFIPLFRGLLEALAVLHGQGVTHGDIKASNVLIDCESLEEDASRAAKLVDFGLAERVTNISDAATFQGTIGYAAPEVYVGQRDSRSDLYSLGILLYELVVGERPFRGSSLEVMREQRAGPAPDPRHWNKEVPESIAALINGLTEPEPAARIQSAEDALRLLGEDVDRRGAPDSEIAVSAIGPLVGREMDLEKLQVAWQSARDGAGGAILLHGERGVGKTRLLNEFKLDVQVSGGLCYSVSATAKGALGRLAQRIVLDHADQLRSKEWGQKLAPLWGGQSAGSAGDQGRWDLAENFVTMLVELSKRMPVVIIFDDMAGAEPALADFVGYLMRSSTDGHWLVVAASDAAVGRFCDSVVGNRAVSMLELGALSEEASNRLLCGLLGESAADTLFTSIHKASAGNPATLQRCLQMLSEDDVIIRSHGSWQVRKAPSVIALPDDLREEILGRLDRLDLRQRRVLATAAAIGEKFDLATLEILLPTQDKGSVASILFAATRLNLVEDRDDSIRFRHKEARDELLKLLDAHEVLAIHQAIVRDFHSRRDQGLSIDQGQLAQHAAAIGDKEGALRAALVAASQSRRRHGTGDETNWLVLARSCCLEGAAAWPVIHARLADLSSTVGDIDSAMEYYPIAIEHQSDNDVRARCTIRFAETLRAAGRGGESIAVLQKTAKEDGISGETHGHNARALARAHYFAGEYPAAIQVAQAGLARIQGESTLAAQLYYEIADSAMTLGTLELAKAAVDSAAEMDPSIGQRARGRLLVHQGNFADACVVLLRVTAQLTENGKGSYHDQTNALSDTNNLGAAHYYLGEWDRAAEVWSRSAMLAERLGDRIQATIALINLVNIYVRCGNHERAEQALRDAFVHVQFGGDPYCYAELLNMRADLAASRGDLTAASNHYRDASERFHQLNVSINQRYCEAMRLELEVRQGQASATILRLQQLLTRAKCADDSAGVCVTARVLCMALRVEGRLQEASEAIAQALDRARGLGDRYELGLTLLESARLMEAFGKPGPARNQAIDARTHFATIGARLMLKEVRTLLANCDDAEPETVKPGSRRTGKGSSKN